MHAGVSIGLLLTRTNGRTLIIHGLICTISYHPITHDIQGILHTALQRYTFPCPFHFFHLRIIDFLVHSVPCGYCCWISLPVHSIYFPHDPLDRISIGDRARYTRRALPPSFILDIDDFSRTARLLYLPASRSIYMYMYISHLSPLHAISSFWFGSCVHGTAPSQRYPLPLRSPYPICPSLLIRVGVDPLFSNDVVVLL